MIVSTKQKQVGAREDAPAHRRLNKRPLLCFCAPGRKGQTGSLKWEHVDRIAGIVIAPGKIVKTNMLTSLCWRVNSRWSSSGVGRRGYVLSIETFWPVTSEKYNEGPETRRPAACKVRRETSGANLLPINPTAWCASVDCRGLS